MVNPEGDIKQEGIKVDEDIDLTFDYGELTWRAFIYDVRCFLGISDLPTYPNQILYYISLFSKIR